MRTYGVDFLGRLPGPINPECVLLIPGTHWVITSSVTDPEQEAGVLYAADSDDLQVLTVYPDGVETRAGSPEFDTSLLAPGPGRLFSHGMAIKEGPDGVHRLYVVNHNVAERPGRQSIEAFDVQIEGGRPRLTHLGGVLLPSGLWPTDVAALPGAGEGFIANSLMDPTDEHGFDKLKAGEPIGQVFTWTPASGWSELPGGPFRVPNGVEVSADGRYVYLALWALREIWRMELGSDEPEILRSHANGVLVDNLTWDSEGNLLCAGQLTDPVSHLTEYAASARSQLPGALLKIDPETLAVRTLFSGAGPDGWGLPTSAVEVGDQIWVGSARADGVLRFTVEAKK